MGTSGWAYKLSYAIQIPHLMLIKLHLGKLSLMFRLVAEELTRAFDTIPYIGVPRELSLLVI